MGTSRKFFACLSAIVLAVATLYAPLYHVHSGAGETPLVHAHLPELEAAEEEGVHVETPHSHATARSVDLLITVEHHPIQLQAVITSDPLDLPPAEPSSGFTPAASPRAHAPPVVHSLIPRAPPPDTLPLSDAHLCVCL
jgi:hypothetical protein